MGVKLRTGDPLRQRPPGGHVRPWAAVVRRAALLVVLAVIVRTWLVEGLFVPLEVTSGSMAEMLLGPHRQVTCDDCQYRFACGAGSHKASRRGVCPNCGFAGNDLQTRPVIGGDRILVQKAIFRFRRPRRWEVVAFRHPQRPSETVVKRVVGLPGESIRIRHGDVYADGVIQRKNLAQQRALAVTVYDADFPPGTLPARWRSEPPQGGWEKRGGRFCYQHAPVQKSVDWLTYQHWRRLPGPADHVEEGPVTNFRGYNQPPVERSESVHTVSDLLLSFRLADVSGPGELLVRITDGRDEFTLVLLPHPMGFRVLRNGQPIAGDQGPGQIPRIERGVRIEVSLIDRQFLFALDGHTVVTYPYGPGERCWRPSDQPLAIGCRGLDVEISSLRVDRDVYYDRPIGPAGRWGLDNPAHLSEHEYYVLGDNSPISEDSRIWPDGPAVGNQLLIGKPLVVYFPVRRVDLGRWHFQVPDPTGIRYIH